MKVLCVRSCSAIPRFVLAGVCIAKSLKISRLATDREFEEIISHLLEGQKARAVVMFVNEDNCRKLLKTLKKTNSSTEITFLASDSWGAKIHPVNGHELVAEGAVTLLPKRRVIEGRYMYCVYMNESKDKYSNVYMSSPRHIQCSL